VANEATDADEDDLADEANMVIWPTKPMWHPNEANKADEAKSNEANEAIVANQINKAIVANEIEASVINEANEVDKAADATGATDANKTDAANKADPTLIDNGTPNVYLFLYFLTKYCAIFAKMKGCFGMMISNNQHGIDSRKLCFWVVSEKGLSSL
jgi:hypothetical protein